MTTYREIHGKAVKSLSTDPTAETDAGQIWYNTTSNTFKSIINLEAWSSASNLINGQSEMAAGGTQTATVKAFGGTPNSLTCEEYNGSGWTSLPNGNTARRLLASTVQGTPSAFLAIGGWDTTYSDKVEEYDGSSWTANPTINTARFALSGAGTATSALAFGGDVPGGPRSNASESFNGSSWTATPNLNTARNGVAGAGGSNTSALCIGGDAGPPGIVTDTEEFDGSSWTTGGALPVAMSTAGSGIQTAALAAGGTPAPNNAKAFSYDGSSWTALPNLGTGRDVNRCSGAGNTANVAIGGSPLLKTTEEFNSSANVITAAAWASGPVINTGRRGMNVSGVGTATAGLIIGGSDPSNATNKTEEYDGSSWTETGNYPSNLQNSGASGIQTAAYNWGGSDGSSILSTANNYNGSSWTSGTAIPSVIWCAAGGGTQTSAISAGGGGPSGPTSISTTLEWNGSSWTAGNSLSTARRYHAGFGVQTSFAAFGGMSPGPAPGATDFNTTEEYDGTNWTSGGNYVQTIRNQNSPASTGNSDGLSVGGNPALTLVCKYDGTTWATDASLSAGKSEAGVIGTSTTAIKAGGIPIVTATEEYTAETSAVNVKTLTQS